MHLTKIYIVFQINKIKCELRPVILSQNHQMLLRVAFLWPNEASPHHNICLIEKDTDNFLVVFVRKFMNIVLIKNFKIILSIK